jgi:integrase
LLRSLLSVAVADSVIAANPCRLRSAGTPKPGRLSRSLSVQEVQALAQAVPSRYGVLVLVLAFGGLRFGEATALRRHSVSADGSTVTVEASVRYLGGRWLVGPPKTDAGIRTVALPSFVATALLAHLSTRVPPDDQALVFGTASGRFLSGANFGKTFRRAVEACGLPPVRIHELRHTGATLAAAAGASTAELMHRLGHASPAAALVYQHAAAHRDVAIARALDDLATGGEVVPIRRAKGGSVQRIANR